MTPSRSRGFSKGSRKPRSSARSSAAWESTARPHRTGRLCMWTRALGERVGDSFDSRDSRLFRPLLFVFLYFVFLDDLLVLQRQIGLDARIIVVAKPRVFVDAEHAPAETLFQWALGLSFLIPVLREVRATTPFG